MAHTQEHDAGKHPKQDFQVERLAFFSDAVFAIAITLLIIEFKVPHISKTSTYDEVLHELLELRVNFISLLLSYVPLHRIGCATIRSSSIYTTTTAI